MGRRQTEIRETRQTRLSLERPGDGCHPTLHQISHHPPSSRQFQSNALLPVPYLLVSAQQPPLRMQRNAFEAGQKPRAEIVFENAEQQPHPALGVVSNKIRTAVAIKAPVACANLIAATSGHQQQPPEAVAAGKAGPLANVNFPLHRRHQNRPNGRHPPEAMKQQRRPQHQRQGDATKCESLPHFPPAPAPSISGKNMPVLRRVRSIIRKWRLESFLFLRSPIIHSGNEQKNRCHQSHPVLE